MKTGRMGGTRGRQALRSSRRIGGIAVAIAIALSVLLLTTGCETLGDVGFDGLFDPDLEDRMAAEMMDEPPPELMFSAAYAYGFGVIWFADPVETYDVGTGTVWELVYADDDEEGRIESERALLERGSQGRTLWYIRTAVEGGDIEERWDLEYEAWIGPDQEVIEFAYRDPETGEVVRTEVPEEHRSRYIVEEDDEEFGTWQEEWEAWEAQATVSSETITVGAGTFNTERMTYEGRDDETGERFRQDIWRTEEVPDHAVRFEFRNLDEDERFEGELISVRSDYRKQLF